MRELMMSRWGVLTGMVVALLLVGGCASEPDPIGPPEEVTSPPVEPEQAAEPEQAEEAESLMFRSGQHDEQGEATADEDRQRLVADVAEQVTLPPSFEMNMWGESSTSHGRLVQVSGTVDQALEDLVERLHDQLVDEGWSQVQVDRQVAERPWVVAERDGVEVKLVVSARGGETSLLVELTLPAE